MRTNWQLPEQDREQLHQKLLQGAQDIANGHCKPFTEEAALEIFKEVEQRLAKHHN